MSGFGTMLAKELREIQHTWRIWVTLGTFAFFGIADPVIARFSPEILASVGYQGYLNLQNQYPSIP